MRRTAQTPAAQTPAAQTLAAPTSIAVTRPRAPAIAMRRAAAPAAFAALLACGGALAQPAPGPVYLSVAALEDGRLRSTFVFSDAVRRGEFAPVAAFSVTPDARSCGVNLRADPEIPEIDRAAPIIDPSNPETPVLPAGLPPAMADAAAALAEARGLPLDDVARAGQQACVRRLWERIVGLRR
ncbi:hypothetical protein SAMN05444370_11929 [Rubrimonas cliftonensis]|uniref:Uncharacterized protein n=1 Tax=Rubrimonas cliftonensis TaxID=89524 RepID=A0A1H4F923_9RHOB|nr:hypothetical protein SAMN05444370_11929 [Rubrimonas cliftonensis]